MAIADIVDIAGLVKRISKGEGSYSFSKKLSEDRQLKLKNALIT